LFLGQSDELFSRLKTAFKANATDVVRQAQDKKLLTPTALDKHRAIYVEVSGEESAEFIRAVMGARNDTQRVIALSFSANPDIMRTLIRAGVSDLLTPTMSDKDLVESADPVRVSGQGARHVIAFTPVLGGMGSTTLAIESALLLAEHGRHSSCLVDLDFYAGECADFLNLPSRLNVEPLVGDESRLDEHLLDSVLSEHSSGLRLLAAQTKIGFSQVINTKSVLQLLNLVSLRFENVVLDMPRAWYDWTDDIILGCDCIFLVTDSSVPALKAARRQLDDVVERYGDKVKPRVIVNKFLRGLFRPVASDSDFKKAFGEFYAGAISDDTNVARAAIDTGVPISSVKSNSRIVKDLAAILAAQVK
jgi:pilus assembly protein CpaE